MTGRLVACLLALALTLALGAVAFPQTIEEKKRSAEREVQELQGRLEDSVERYNYACYQLERTREQLGEKRAEVREATLRLAGARSRLNARARAMYVNGRSQFVQVLVDSRSFDDLLVALDFQKRVGGRDAAVVSRVKATRAGLEAARVSLEETKSEQESARRELAGAKASIEASLSGARGRLSDVQDQERQIREALARQAAEAERQRALAESARQRAASNQSGTRSNPAPVPRPGPTVAPAPAPLPAPHGGVAGVAHAQLGKPYVWAAAGPNSFDCSGLVQYCYRVGAGMYIPHSSYAQARCGKPVSVGQLQPGDIVGFRGWGHVGLYIGGGSFIHAPRSGDVVKIAPLSSRRDFCGAVRP